MQTQTRTFDRAAEDLGNIVNLGHVNTRIPDQRISTAYYVTALGLTRDPFIMTGTNNMWINAGMSQFHLPTNAPQVLRGTTALVLPDLEALLPRLRAASKELDGTKFAFRELEGAVETFSPWGNRIVCYAPDRARFGPIVLGMAYLEFDVPAGAAAGIARFYRDVLQAQAELLDEREGRVANVQVGEHQYFRFRETDRPLPEFDGNHVQVYFADFSGPHRRLQELGLITEESDRWQYRFSDIVDLDSKRVLYTLEHEVRSMSHPLYGRPLVNRNPQINNNAYAAGHESLAWAMN
jgi:hypothetical protein